MYESRLTSHFVSWYKLVFEISTSQSYIEARDHHHPSGKYACSQSDNKIAHISQPYITVTVASVHNRIQVPQEGPGEPDSQQRFTRWLRCAIKEGGSGKICDDECESSVSGSAEAVSEDLGQG